MITDMCRLSHVLSKISLLKELGEVPCVTSPIGRASLARENEAVGSWGQEVHILLVNI